jgi:hypothetical protein
MMHDEDLALNVFTSLMPLPHPHPPSKFLKVPLCRFRIFNSEILKIKKKLLSMHLFLLSTHKQCIVSH